MVTARVFEDCVYLRVTSSGIRLYMDYAGVFDDSCNREITAARVNARVHVGRAGLRMGNDR